MNIPAFIVPAHSKQKPVSFRQQYLSGGKTPEAELQVERALSERLQPLPVKVLLSISGRSPVLRALHQHWLNELPNMHTIPDSCLCDQPLR